MIELTEQQAQALTDETFVLLRVQEFQRLAHVDMMIVPGRGKSSRHWRENGSNTTTGMDTMMCSWLRTS